MSRRRKDWDKIDKNTKTRKSNKHSKIWSIILLITFFIYTLYLFIKWPIYDSLLKKSGKTESGKIINERGHNGKGGHMLKEEDGDRIIYEYEFEVNGKNYRGDSQSADYKINDTIDVLYMERFPEINRPKYYLYK